MCKSTVVQRRKASPSPAERASDKAQRGASDDDMHVPLTPATAEAVNASARQERTAAAAPMAKGSDLEDATDIALAVLVLTFSVLIGVGSPFANWLLILGALLSTAVYSLGVVVAKQMLAEAFTPSPAPAEASWLRVPLTDSVLSMDTINKFANSCQVREKGLKVLQYILKAGHYSALFSKDASKAMKDLSKLTSLARRFFKFCRWCKHFEDLQEAKDEKGSHMRALLYLRVAANFGADWAEDVCSLERIGVLAKGTLSVEFMLFAEYCQLVLALIEVYVTTARARKEHEKTIKVASATDSAPKAVLKQQRKLTMTRLELVKYVSDLGKACFDCEMSFAHEGVFIGCALFSGILSTHKNMFKVLK